MSTNEKTNPLRSFAICCKIWNHPDVLYKYHVNKESDLDLDLPDLPASKTVKQPQSKTAYQSQAEETGGFNPFGAYQDQRSKAGFDPDWANRIMETYKPHILENGAKFLLSYSLIEQTILAGDKILLFSQSLLSLDLIEEYLQNLIVPNTNEMWKKYKHYYRLDGSTTGVERERLINAFNKPNNDAWLFLLSTRAGCLGINLIGANRVIVLDASWNPCHDAQAVCRVYRYGQKKTCFIYRLIADHTMEKKIYDRQISKQTMSDRVIDEIQAANHFTRTEVEKLIHYVKEDVPSADLSKMPERFDDQVLIRSCMKHSNVITKEPFTHESLLIDKKEYQLSEREKSLAFRDYHHDKKYFPTSRPSTYSQFYNRTSLSNPSLLNSQFYNPQLNPLASAMNYSALTPASSSLSNSSIGSSSSSSYSSLNSFQQHNQHENYQNNDLDFKLSHNLLSMNYNLNANGHSNRYQLSTNTESPVKPAASNQLQNLKDVKVSRFTVSAQIMIPPSSSDVATGELTHSSGPTLIQPGQQVFLLQTLKGIFLRTQDKKYIALSDDTYRNLLANATSLDNADASKQSNTTGQRQEPRMSQNYYPMPMNGQIHYAKYANNSGNYLITSNDNGVGLPANKESLLQ